LERKIKVVNDRVIVVKVKKAKFTVVQAMKAQKRNGSLVLHHSPPSTLAVDGGEWSTPSPGRFTPGKETRFPLYRRLGGPQVRAWTCAENLAPTGIRSPDRPACREVAIPTTLSRPTRVIVIV